MQGVDVVFVNYRSEEDIAQVVEGMAEAPSLGLHLSVRVVDCSGMAAGAAALLAAAPVPTELVHAGGNIGFGPAANVGAASGTAPVLAFVNPDVALDLSQFAALVRAGSSGGAVAWSGILHNGDGSVQRNAAPPPSLRRLAAEYLLGLDTRLPMSDRERDVGVLTGAVLLVDRGTFQSVGGFAPDFPLYMEDVDLSRRLASRGRLVQYPIEVGVHTGGRSTLHAPRETWVLLHASRVLFFARRGRTSGVAARAVVLTGALLRAVLTDRQSLKWLPQLVRATAPGFRLVTLLPSPPGGEP